MPSVEQFIGAADAAKILGVSQRRVQQLVEGGHLEKVTTIGRSMLLRRADVERLAEEGWPGRRPKGE